MKKNSTTAASLAEGRMAGKTGTRYVLAALSLVFCQMLPVQADAEVSISIGFNVPTYPNLVPVPGYPVYYDPRADSNYFFYDGLYWVYQDDNWYVSSWYNGPWQLSDPDAVPLFILRVPVRYYRRPPEYFHGWVADGPPHWGQHWGNDWRERHNGWNHWDRNAAPHAAPLPVYQRQYSGNRYPRQEEQQRAIVDQNYHYQPREPASQQHFQPHDQQRDQRQTVQHAPSAYRPAGQQVQIVQPAQSRPQAAPAARQAPAPQPQAQPREQAQPQGRDRGNAGHGDEHRGDQNQGQGRDNQDHGDQGRDDRDHH